MFWTAFCHRRLCFRCRDCWQLCIDTAVHKASGLQEIMFITFYSLNSVICLFQKLQETYVFFIILLLGGVFEHLSFPAVWCWDDTTSSYPTLSRLARTVNCRRGLTLPGGRRLKKPVLHCLCDAEYIVCWACTSMLSVCSCGTNAELPHLPFS